MARVPPESQDIIESTPRSSCVGVEPDHFTIDGLIEVLGGRRAIDVPKRIR
jgi:hypothetical protein